MPPVARLGKLVKPGRYWVVGAGDGTLSVAPVSLFRDDYREPHIDFHKYHGQTVIPAADYRRKWQRLYMVRIRRHHRLDVFTLTGAVHGRWELV
jgi:hypothetical protein